MNKFKLLTFVGYLSLFACAPHISYSMKEEEPFRSSGASLKLSEEEIRKLQVFYTNKSIDVNDLKLTKEQVITVAYIAVNVALEKDPLMNLTHPNQSNEQFQGFMKFYMSSRETSKYQPPKVEWREIEKYWNQGNLNIDYFDTACVKFYLNQWTINASLFNQNHAFGRPFLHIIVRNLEGNKDSLVEKAIRMKSDLLQINPEDLRYNSKEVEKLCKLEREIYGEKRSEPTSQKKNTYLEFASGFLSKGDK